LTKKKNKEKNFSKENQFIFQIQIDMQPPSYSATGGGYFESQKVDEAGHKAVFLQKLIIALIVVSVIARIIGIIAAVLYAGGWSFYVGFLVFVILAIGFIGAKQRNPTLVLVYAIIATIWAFFDWNCYYFYWISNWCCCWLYCF